MGEDVGEGAVGEGAPVGASLVTWRSAAAGAGARRGALGENRGEGVRGSGGVEEMASAGVVQESGAGVVQEVSSRESGPGAVQEAAGAEGSASKGADICLAF